MKWLQTPWTLLVICFLCTIRNVALADSSDDDDLSYEEEKPPPEEPSLILEDIAYDPPVPSGPYHLFETFDEADSFKKRWVLSTARKEDTELEISKYDGKWRVEQSKEAALKGDFGLALKSKAKHHAVSIMLDKPFHFENKPFILQYEVNFQEGQECGGAYLKLLTASPNLKLAEFHDKTPYTIMFGPDKCGSDHKVHFIFRHKNPLNGTISEKHSKPADAKMEEIFKDKRSHLFTLIISPDNSYVVNIDQVSANKGNLLEDFTPPVNPPKEIDDPYDKKPDDWDEREKIADPSARKPDDWNEDAPRQLPDPTSKKPENWLDDEPEMIPDPNAEKPADWEDEMDGEWEAPLLANPKCEEIGCGPWKPAMIDNPEYKGKWRAPLIANPNYKGKWKPRKIANADYYEDDYPFRMSSIGAVGLELWSMSADILFDNILITNDKSVADSVASQTWELKRRKADRDSESIIKRLLTYTNTRPWLWAVYVVVIGLPIVLIFAFCCTTTEERKRAAALAKKTDEPVPDDPQPPTLVTKEPSPIRVERKPEDTSIKEASEKELEEVEENEKEKEDSGEKEVVAEEESEVSGHDGSGDVDRSPRRRKPRRE